MAVPSKLISSRFDMQRYLGITQAQVHNQVLPQHDSATAPSAPKLCPVSSPADDGDIPSISLPPPAYQASDSPTGTSLSSQTFLLTPRSSDQSFVSCEDLLPSETASRLRAEAVVGQRARSFSWSIASRDRAQSIDGSTILDVDELAVYENRINILQEQAAQRARRAEAQAAFAYDQVTLAGSDVVAHGRGGRYRQGRHHTYYPQVYTYEEFRRIYAAPSRPSAARGGTATLPPPISARDARKASINWSKVAMSSGVLCLIIGVIAGLSVVARVTSDKPDAHH